MTTKRLRILLFTPEGSSLIFCRDGCYGTPLEELFLFRLKVAAEVIIDWKVVLFGAQFLPALQEEYDLIIVNLVPTFSYDRWLAPFINALTAEQRQKVLGHGVFAVPEWEFPVVGVENLLEKEKILAAILCPGVTVK